MSANDDPVWTPGEDGELGKSKYDAVWPKVDKNPIVKREDWQAGYQCKGCRNITWPTPKNILLCRKCGTKNTPEESEVVFQVHTRKDGTKYGHTKDDEAYLKKKNSDKCTDG